MLVAGSENVAHYLAAAEDASGIEGLTTFGLAVSLRESGWNNLAVNDSPREAAEACEAWERQRTRKLRDSPYNSEKFFCWGTGGWFGAMPAYDLARNPFENLNPLWAVHDPATSTAMFVARIVSVVRKHFPSLPKDHRNWLSVRRSQASLRTMRDFLETKERAKLTRQRLESDLETIGVDPGFMYTAPSIAEYPGNAAVWDALRDVRPLKESSR
jgi:hypothetical protein